MVEIRGERGLKFTQKTSHLSDLRVLLYFFHIEITGGYTEEDALIGNPGAHRIAVDDAGQFMSKKSF